MSAQPGRQVLGMDVRQVEATIPLDLRELRRPYRFDAYLGSNRMVGAAQWRS